MELKLATLDDVKQIVGISINAFESDILVGGKEGDFPPNYDSVYWHIDMVKNNHLYKAIVDGEIIGGAILFLDDNQTKLYIGRIFIDAKYHHQGYGLKLMELIESYFKDVKQFDLDTPVWNNRTNNFYKKCGYTLTKVDDGFSFYNKKFIKKA